MTVDLVAFLRARLDEDERIAREADGPHWRPGDGNVSEGGLYALDGDPAGENDGWAIAWFKMGETNPGQQLPAFSNRKRHPHENSVHAARHDPARVLREVEAKRRIVDSFAASGLPLATRNAEFAVVRMVLRLLALPHADHPDFRDEWRV